MWKWFPVPSSSSSYFSPSPLSLSLSPLCFLPPPLLPPSFSCLLLELLVPHTRHSRQTSVTIQQKSQTCANRSRLKILPKTLSGSRKYCVEIWPIPTRCSGAATLNKVALEGWEAECWAWGRFPHTHKPAHGQN